MVLTLHKFRHYLLGNFFVFYVDHMALVYLVNKPQVSGRVVRWLLLFSKYDFTLVCKLGKIHVLQMLCLNYLMSQIPNETQNKP
jgi:hypothetical protein